MNIKNVSKGPPVFLERALHRKVVTKAYIEKDLDLLSSPAVFLVVRAHTYPIDTLGYLELFLRPGEWLLLYVRMLHMTRVLTKGSGLRTVPSGKTMSQPSA